MHSITPIMDRGKESFSESRLNKIMMHPISESEWSNGDVDRAARVKFTLKQGDVRQVLFIMTLYNDCLSGIPLYLVQRDGKYKKRVLTLDSTERRLVFLKYRKDDIAVQVSVIDSVLMYLAGPAKGMNIYDIAEIRPGYTSALFSKIEPPPDAMKEHLAVSFVSSEGTVCVVMRSERDREFVGTDMMSWLHMQKVTSIMY